MIPEILNSEPYFEGQKEVSSEINSKCSTRDHKRTTVRFTDVEYGRIVNEAKLSGESIPTLLRKSHFSKKKLKLLFTEFERHTVCTELRRIGNNVNQIAKKVNSGVLEGWHSELEEVKQMLSRMYLLAVGAYGSR